MAFVMAWALPLMAVVQAAMVLLMFAMDAGDAASIPMPEAVTRDSLIIALLPDPLTRTAWSPILVNRQLLYPFIAFTAMIGLYAATFSIVQLVHAVIIGFVIFLLSARNYPAVPFLLGFILGPFFEKTFRTSMALSGGDITIFFRSSFSLVFLVLSVAMIYFLGIRLPKMLKKSV